MTDLTHPRSLPAGPDYPNAGSPAVVQALRFHDLDPALAGDGTEGPDSPPTPAPEPPGFPDVPELPDDSDEDQPKDEDGGSLRR